MAPNPDPDRADLSATFLELPPAHELTKKLLAQAVQSEPIERYLNAVQSGMFNHPDGRTDPLEDTALQPEQAAVLAHLCRNCKQTLSVEVGFGMGSSATVILATRRSMGKPFTHLVFDPFGLPDKRGEVVQSYLEEEFGPAFKRIRKRSETGLGSLLAQKGRGRAGLIYIDGDHRFESVMAEFVLADLLCAEGGYIMFDDACYPGVETAISYIRENRPDYALAHLPVENASVLQKTGPDTRRWDSFRPFPVPQRYDWTPALTAADEETPPSSSVLKKWLAGLMAWKR